MPDHTLAPPALKPTSANLKRAENHRAAILHADRHQQL